jgi:hypothetical protein
MALGANSLGLLGGAASDLFAAEGDRAKAGYDFAEGKAYGLASQLAFQNEEFTKTSTAIKEAQQQREAMMQIGGQQADVASAGFAASGSSLDLLRDSASQAALTHAVIGQQGLITEAGYEEQGQSYRIMQGAANDAGTAANNAGTLAEIMGGIKGIAGLASLALAPVTGGASLVVGQAAESAIGDPTGIGGLY